VRDEQRIEGLNPSTKAPHTLSRQETRQGDTALTMINKQFKKAIYQES